MSGNIAFYRVGLIGDCIVALRAICALKSLYPRARLVVLTNNFGAQIYKNFDFIDLILNIESLESSAIIEKINSFNFELCVLSQSNRKTCALIDSTNIKKIITFFSAGSAFKRRFRTILISRNFNKTSQFERLLMLIRKIDKNHFDKHIKNIDFGAIKLRANEKNKYFVREFLNKNEIKNPIVLINPFVRSTFVNLNLGAWCELCETLSEKYKHINFIIPTYKNNPEFLANGANIHIFMNDDDLLNLVALLEFSDFVISPSTALSHMADNLNIKMIWLCSKIDKFLWRGANMDARNFVVFDNKNQARATNRILALFAREFGDFIESRETQSRETK